MDGQKKMKLSTRPNRMSRFWIPLLILILAILFNWKLTLTRQYIWLEHPDGINQVLPWFQFQAAQWHHWQFPAWDPNAWTGQPLFGQAQPGAAYPFNWLIFLAPLKDGFIRIVYLNWYVVFIRFLGALTGYSLCRDLGCSRIASFVGAFVFGMGGFLGKNGWPQMLNGAIWAPLVFLYLFRVARRERTLRSALLSGFFLGFAWLSGHHQVPTYLFYSALGIWTWLCVRDGKWDWSMAKLGLLSIFMAVAASAVQTFPTTEYGRLSVRWVGAEDPIGFNVKVPYYAHERLAHSPTSILGVFMPNIDPAWPMFIGIVAFALAILGTILAWREPQVRCLAVLAGGALFFTIGPNSLLHGIMYAVLPLIDKTRSAGAATAIFGAAIAPLAAIGLDRISKNEWWMKRTSLILAVAGVALICASFVFKMIETKGSAADERVILSGVCALAFSAVLAGWRSGSVSIHGGSVGVFAIVLFELALVTNYWLPARGRHSEGTPLTNNLTKHRDIAGFLRTRSDHGRIEYRTDDIPYNFGDWFNLETFQSYTASVTTNIWNHSLFDRPGRNFMGVRYSIAKAPDGPEQQLLFESQSGLKVFENRGALPRVWSVHRSARAPDRSAVVSALGAGLDARETVVLVGEGIRLNPCPEDKGVADRTDLTLHEANHVVISATLRCPGMVILNDTWFPGWSASVDGKPVEIHEAYGIFRGVLAPAGQHTVEMHYRPLSVIAGGFLTLFAAAIALMTWMGVLFRSAGHGTNPLHKRL